MATRSISELFFACSKVFNEELDALRLHGGVRMSKWDDEKGRLRIWASNIGAHQTGQSSLDFRLRDAPHIHQQLIDLLGDFIGAIYEIRAILSGPKNDHPQSTDFDDPDTSPYENPETEINHLHDSFVNIIDCLFHISMLVRKPARHKFPTYPELESQFEPIDTYHVTHKFLAANTVITQRLGRANTGRRVYLKRRERRRGKFGKDMGKIQDQTLSDTVATEFTDNGKDDSVSLGVTSYASSLQSGASPTIPPPPKQSAEQKPFECPFCFYIITIDNTYSWTEHIFQDLLPYICPYSDCPVPEKLYDNRHDWSDHLRSSHLTFYNDRVCPLCENITESGPQLERHLARHLEDLALFVLPVTDKDETTKDDTQMASPGIETIAENTEQDQIIEKEPAEPDVMDIDQPKQSRQKQANTEPLLSGPARKQGGEKSKYWYCCQCWEGPFNSNVIIKCVKCEHVGCISCLEVSERYTRINR